MPWFLGRGIIPIIVWSSFWKGLALWHAAKRDEKWWFIALLLINTVGILEICYLAFIVKLFSSSNAPPKHSSRKR